MIHRHLQTPERHFLAVITLERNADAFKELLNKELQVMHGVHAVSACDVIVHEFGAGQAIVSVNTESIQAILTVIPFTGARVVHAPSPFVPYVFQ